MMAGSVVTTLPVLLLFLALQRYYIAGPDGGQRQGMMRRRVASRPRRLAPRCLRSLASRCACTLPRAAAADSDAAACSTTSPTSRRGRPCASDGVRASIQRRRRRRSGHGAAPRLRSRRAPPATRSRARALPLDLPANYEITFYLRGDAPVNDFQVKLVDASGDNVWWFNRRELRLSARLAAGADQEAPDRLRVGPDRRIARCSTSPTPRVRRRRGTRRRQGLARISDLTLRRAAADRRRRRRRRAARVVGRGRRRRRSRSTATPRPRGGATRRRRRAEPHARLRPRARVRRPGPALAGRAVRIALRRRALRRRRALAHACAASSDGNGGHDRDLRCRSPRRATCASRLHDGPARGATRSPSSRSRTSPSARRRTHSSRRSRASSPRGYFPRGFSGEQPYWTIVGIDGGSDSGLLSRGRRARGGAAAGSRSSRSSSPTARLVTWADVDAQPFLRDGYLPMPERDVAAIRTGRCT